MIVDQTQENKNQLNSTPAHITSAHFDERVIGCGVSEARSQLDLESLDDPRVIVLSATHSTSTIGEVL